MRRFRQFMTESALTPAQLETFRQTWNNRATATLVDLQQLYTAFSGVRGMAEQLVDLNIKWASMVARHWLADVQANRILTRAVYDPRKRADYAATGFAKPDASPDYIVPTNTRTATDKGICTRCQGSGQYGDYGTCFDCGGTGRRRSK